MKDKYYTPSLEELLTFIVNEKYCYTTGINKKYAIFKMTFTEPNFVTSLHDFIEGNDCNDYTGEDVYSINPRVYLLKYLDDDDFKKLNIKNHSVILNNGVVDIWRSSDSYPIIRNVKIKNIFELKTLLKWLNITYQQ